MQETSEWVHLLQRIYVSLLTGLTRQKQHNLRETALTEYSGRQSATGRRSLMTCVMNPVETAIYVVFGHLPGLQGKQPYHIYALTHFSVCTTQKRFQ